MPEYQFVYEVECKMMSYLISCLKFQLYIFRTQGCSLFKLSITMYDVDSAKKKAPCICKKTVIIYDVCVIKRI